MPGVSRIQVDTAGGRIIGVLAPTVFVDGANIVVEYAEVEGHGVGGHGAPVMWAHSPNVFANGLNICRRGDVATCGHRATGSADVFANDRS